MHICWRSSTQSGYTSWYRIDKNDRNPLSISLNNITSDRRLLPKISGFSHPHSSSVSPDEEIWFEISTDGNPMRYLES